MENERGNKERENEKRREGKISKRREKKENIV